MKFRLIFLILTSILALQCGFTYGSEETIIYLTRHGETHWNTKKLWQGSTDTNLNLNGIRQATTKAEFFMDMKVDAVYSSPLQRALLTAQIIASPHEKVAIPRFDLIEPWQGKLQGMPHADNLNTILPRLGALTQEERRNTGYLLGLMSDAMIAERTETELVCLAKMHPGGLIVAVTHSDVLEAIVTMHTDAIHEMMQMTNMAYLKYAYDGENLTLIEVSPDIKYQSYE
jgi:broad specificity phosphatase PhoE